MFTRSVHRIAGRISRRPPPSTRSRSWTSFLTGVALGAGVAYELDPARGRQRRERGVALVRRSTRRLERGARVAALRSSGRLKGVLHQLRPRLSTEPLDDAGLAHKVESVLFRDPQVPKGQISINAEDGKVFLRGQVESPQLIDDLTEAVRTIAGVETVVNLLHLPGTPAPHPGDRSPDTRRA